MTGKEKQMLLNVIDIKGFNYTFMNYSDFKDIKDETFHVLRQNYEYAEEALRAYIED